MTFEPLPIDGSFLVHLEPIADRRGFFARLFCTKQWKEHGLSPEIAQINVSFTKKKGTIRGLHYQTPPHEEAKCIRCLRGRIFDVVADLRPGSPTFGTWTGRELTAENRDMIVIPKGCAHGFQALEDDSEVLYLSSTPFDRDADSGIRHDDPSFAIIWPLPVVELSEKDRSFPDFKR